MKEFEVTLTAVSRKTFKLRADSQEDAFLLAEAILENTDLLDFSDEDVDSMDMTCEEQCGGVCEICSRACEDCGDCTDLEPDCPYLTRNANTVVRPAAAVWQTARMTDSVFGWFQRMFDPAGRTGLQYTSKHRLCDTTKAACQGKAPETPHWKGEI